MQTVEIIGRLLIALAVVLGAIWMIARKLRGSARQKLRTTKLIDVLGRQSLSRSSSVAVVRVAGQAMVVGLTDHNVRVLATVPLDEVQSWIANSDPTARRSSARDLDHRGRAAGQARDPELASPGGASTIENGLRVVMPQAERLTRADLGPAPLTAADIEEIRARRARASAATTALAPDQAGSAAAGLGLVAESGRQATVLRLHPQHDSVSAASASAASASAAGSAMDTDPVALAAAMPDARLMELPPAATPRRGSGPLAGSALSPQTWRQTLDALRDLTTRKG